MTKPAKVEILRSSYFIKGGDDPSVSIYVAEANDDGTYACLKDSVSLGPESVMPFEEIGRCMGGDYVETVAEDLSVAMSWLELCEKDAKESQVYTRVEAFPGTDIPHVAEVKADIAAQREARRKAQPQGIRKAAVKFVPPRP